MKSKNVICLIGLFIGLLVSSSYAQDLLYDFSKDTQGDSWESVSGFWGAEGGMFYEYQDAGGPLVAATGDSKLTDYAVGVQAMGLAADGDWGIVFRYADINNFYSWQFVNATLSLIKYLDGTRSTLFSAGQQEILNEWQDFRVVVKGDTFACYWNGELKTTVTDGDIPSGQVGLFGWVNSGTALGDAPGYLAFDNFYVTTKEKWTVTQTLPTDGYRVNQLIQGITLQAAIAEGASVAKLTVTEKIPAGLTVSNIQAGTGKFAIQDNVITWTLENVTKSAALTYDLKAPGTKTFGDIVLSGTASDGSISTVISATLPYILEEYTPLTKPISFDFSNASQDSEWEDLSGDWGIQDGMYYEFKDADGPLVSVTGDATVSNYTITVKAMGLVTGADWGIAFRVQDVNNHYSWQFVNGALECILYNKGGRSTLYTEPLDEILDEWQDFKVEAVGNTFNLYWNGELKTTITDKTLGWGRIGLFGWVNAGSPVADTIGGVVFDDFKAVGPAAVGDWMIQ